MKVNATKTGHVAADERTFTLSVDLTTPTGPTYTTRTSLQVGVAFSALVATTNTDITRFEATDLPAGLTIDRSSGAISGTPTTANASFSTVTVTVSDSAGNTTDVDLTFPAVEKGDQTLVGFTYSASSITFGAAPPTLTAPTGFKTSLSYSASPASVCTVDSSNGAVTIVGPGDCVITATAAASADYNEAKATFTVTIQSLGALVLHLDTITDDDIINITEKAAGFSISGNTGSEADVDVTVTIAETPLTTTSMDISGTAEWSVDIPEDASYITESSVAVTVNATKTGHVAAEGATVTLTVDLTAPTAPTYAAPGSLQVGVELGALAPATNTDIASYEATGLPDGLTIDGSSGAISGTPTTASVASSPVTVTVTDGAGNTAETDLTFPTVDKGDQTLVGFAYSAASITFGATAPTVTAPSGVQTSLSYSASPATVCTVDSADGTLTIVGPGDCEVTVTASGDANYNEATDTFTLTVQAVGTLVLNLDAITDDDTINIAEKASGFEISGNTGSEADVDVTVTIAETPLTTTSTDNSGTAEWSVNIPADASYITESSVEVTVNATKTGHVAANEETVTLTVDLTVPTAPTYTAPASLQVGVAISALVPTTDTDIASYAATGLPDGLSIDDSSGAISDTPTTASTSTATVTVTVSDSAGNPATVSTSRSRRSIKATRR